MHARQITAGDLRGLPGLRGAAIERILAAQPSTALEALHLRDIGRKTVSVLVARGLLTDPERVVGRGLSGEEFHRVWPKA